MAGQTIVTNTQLTWVYNRAENQVLVNDYEEDPNTFSLTTFLSEFDSTYTAESYAREDDRDVVTLIPVDPLSSFRSVRLYAETGIVRRLVVVDINDVQMDIQLSNILFDPEITDQSFIFSVPDDADVIDLRDN
jgi:outer membrane lipoprotein carrier protein